MRPLPRASRRRRRCRLRPPRARPSTARSARAGGAPRRRRAAEAVAPRATRARSSIQPRFAASTKKRPIPSAITAPPAIANPRAPTRSQSRASSPSVRRGGGGGRTASEARRWRRRSSGGAGGCVRRSRRADGRRRRRLGARRWPMREVDSVSAASAPPRGAGGRRRQGATAAIRVHERTHLRDLLGDARELALEPGQAPRDRTLRSGWSEPATRPFPSRRASKRRRLR